MTIKGCDNGAGALLCSNGVGSTTYLNITYKCCDTNNCNEYIDSTTTATTTTKSTTITEPTTTIPSTTTDSTIISTIINPVFTTTAMPETTHPKTTTLEIATQHFTTTTISIVNQSTEIIDTNSPGEEASEDSFVTSCYSGKSTSGYSIKNCTNPSKYCLVKSK